MEHDNFLGSLIVSVVVGLISYFKSRKSLKSTEKKIETHVEEASDNAKKIVEDVRTQLTVVIENDCKKEIVYLLSQFDSFQSVITSHLLEDKHLRDELEKIKLDLERHEKWFTAFHSALMSQQDQIRDIYKSLAKQNI